VPESSQPPHPPVSTVARMLATVALLHGSGHDGSGIDDSGPEDSGLDATTVTALVDAVAYLTSTGDAAGAGALIRLVTTDPDTIAAVHVALRVPAPRPNSAAPAGGPPPLLPRRIPGPYRDPGEAAPATRSDAAPPATGPHPTTTTPGPGPRLAGSARTVGPGGSDGSDGAVELPLSETRRWREATAAQVLLLDYAVTGADGQVTGVYTAVPIVHPPDWCDHLDTICGGCLTGWSEDHAVAVFRHGIDGAATGCRCPVCRTTIPTHPHNPADPDSHPDPDHPTAGHPGGNRTSRDTSWFGGEGS